MTDPAGYGPVMAGLLREPRLMPLGPGRPTDAARPLLQALTVEAAFAHAPLSDPDMAAACLAGLWLAHDFLDESHAISQALHSATGGYWHGLMHRREPDYANAKYWFRRVGRHPVFEPLCQAVRADVTRSRPDARAAFLGTQEEWDPFAFIDLCEAAAGAAPVEALCRHVQQREWELLFDYSYRQAVGAG